MSGQVIVHRESPFESRRFGRSFSRIEVPFGVTTTDALATVTQLLVEDDADIVVLRHPAAMVGWFAALLSADRVLIAADTLTYWSLAVGEGRVPAAVPTVTARVADSPEGGLVEELVTDMFTGYGNHYLANPLLDPSAALAGYVEWGRRSATEDTAVIVSVDDHPVGLATLETTAGISEIQLAGIRQDFQRQRLYAHLLAACEDKARALGSERLVISTQAHNTNVQRAWARYGFEPVGAISTVHAVRRGLLR